MDQPAPFPFARNLARWQVLLLLAGFPLVYLVNNFTPWSMGLFLEGRREWWLPFFATIFVLHWTHTVVTVWMLYKAGGSLAEIGLLLSTWRVAIALAVFAGVGALYVWLRTTWPVSPSPPTDWQVIYPFSTAERVVMIFMATSAGICEELIYRGFAIRTLQGRGWKLWQALLLAALAFIVMHGITGLVAAPLFLLSALLFSGLYLWRGSLWPAVYVHVLWDLMTILAV
jgi:membrane protease YdiL (CAAX protease family)